MVMVADDESDEDAPISAVARVTEPLSGASAGKNSAAAGESAVPATESPVSPDQLPQSPTPSAADDKVDSDSDPAAGPNDSDVMDDDDDDDDDDDVPVRRGKSSVTVAPVEDDDEDLLIDEEGTGGEGHKTSRLRKGAVRKASSTTHDRERERAKRHKEKQARRKAKEEKAKKKAAKRALKAIAKKHAKSAGSDEDAPIGHAAARKASADDASAAESEMEYSDSDEVHCPTLRFARRLSAVSSRRGGYLGAGATYTRVAVACAGERRGRQ